MPSPLIIWVMLSLVVSILVIAGVHRVHAEDVRTLKKPLWYLAAFVPVVEAIDWVWLGRPERGPPGKRVAKDRGPAARGRRSPPIGRWSSTA